MMTSKSVLVPFMVSLAALPLIFVVAVAIGGPAEADRVTLVLFGATVLVEVVALRQALSARKLFSPSDSGRLTWTLIVLFLVVRLAAEARLTTLNFQIVPKYTDGGSAGLFFYTIVLRYLYTLSDVLFLCALATTIRAYKSTGLRFELMRRDYLYILLVWAMPALTYVFRDNLVNPNITTADSHIATYRLVAVIVGAAIATLCLVVRRYVVQMGGGAVARVWNMVVVAGISRVASFLCLALLSDWWRAGAAFAEQHLLWVFSCCWLLAALYQQEVLPRADGSEVVKAAAQSKAAG
jgi:hypothetical protein